MMLRLAFLVVSTFALAACAKSEPMPSHGGETNWLQTCNSDSPCEQGACICGVCTTECEEASDCSGDFAGRCVETLSAVDVGACGDRVLPPDSVCLPRCEDSECGDGFACRDEVCVVATVTGDGDGDGDGDTLSFTIEMENERVYIAVSEPDAIQERTCSGTRLEKRSASGERLPLRDDRPPSFDNPGYYMGGRYFEPSFNLGCDELSCGPLREDRLYIGTALEYVKIGTQPAPITATNAGELVDVVEPRALSGEIVAILHYSPDPLGCDDREIALDFTLSEEGECCPVSPGGCTFDGAIGGWARSLDECSPNSGAIADAAYLLEDDPHDCPVLIERPDLCCGCVTPAEDLLNACTATEPCGVGSAQLSDAGTRFVNWDSVGCILDALAAGTPGRYLHETSSIFGAGSFGARHTFIIAGDGSLTYARASFSYEEGVMTGEINETAMRCEPSDATYFSSCMGAIAADPMSDEAWLCAFGSGSVTTPSHLLWWMSCVETEVMCE